MKRWFLLLFMSFLFDFSVFSQQNKLYSIEANAENQINEAIQLAQASNKHVLLQIGGDWCPWCIKLHKLFTRNFQIDSMIKADYVWVMVNYSRENRNLETMARLGYPQRFGFPVLVVLDDNGNRLHTQNSVYFESCSDQEDYDVEKILGFLKDWNKDALAPENYKKKTNDTTK